MHNYFHSLVGGATFGPTAVTDPTSGRKPSLATSINDQYSGCFIPIWIGSGLNSDPDGHAGSD